jgi:hypothetical protein
MSTDSDFSFEVHLHGQIAVQPHVTSKELAEVLSPLCRLMGVHSWKQLSSFYDTELGVVFDPHQHLLQLCWTAPGHLSFRPLLDELCLGLNEIAAKGGVIEVSMCLNEDEDDDDDDDDEPTVDGHNARFPRDWNLSLPQSRLNGDRQEDEADDEDDETADEPRDQFFMLFIGPTPATILQVHRDLMVRDVVSLMERHFETHELLGVVSEIDALFANRLTYLMGTVQLRVPRLGTGTTSNHHHNNSNSNNSNSCIHHGSSNGIDTGSSSNSRPKNQSWPHPQDSPGTQGQGCGGTTGL